MWNEGCLMNMAKEYFRKVKNRKFAVEVDRIEVKYGRTWRIAPYESERLDADISIKVQADSAKELDACFDYALNYVMRKVHGQMGSDLDVKETDVTKT